MEYLFNQYEYIIDDSNNQYQLQLLLHDSIAQGLGRKASAPHHTHTHTHTHTRCTRLCNELHVRTRASL